MKLRVTNLTKSFKKQVVFENVNLEIEENGVYGLVSPNGYGKTTLLKLICGLLQLDKGVIDLSDDNKIDIPFKELGYLQPPEVLYGYLTGRDHLQFICDTHGISENQLLATSKQFQIIGFLDKKIKHYSLGMKQRLLLAMVMVKEPKIILLDEPLNGLDPTSTIIVRDMLISLKNRIVIVSSHDLNELTKVTDSFFFIENKQLKRKSFLPELWEYFEVVVNSDEAVYFFDFIKDQQVEYKKLDRYNWRIRLPKGELMPFIESALSYNLHNLQIEKIKLGVEDYYRKKYHEEDDAL